MNVDQFPCYPVLIDLGSDFMTRFERVGAELQRYAVLLDRLSEAARADVCWHTAERTYGDNKGKVSAARRHVTPAWERIWTPTPDRSRNAIPSPGSHFTACRQRFTPGAADADRSLDG
jgi:hypothetical protein